MSHVDTEPPSCSSDNSPCTNIRVCISLEYKLVIRACCACVYVSACLRLFVCVPVCVRACVHACVSVCACVRACVRTCVHGKLFAWRSNVFSQNIQPQRLLSKL